jgi:excisionase family DNA binding protein
VDVLTIIEAAKEIGANPHEVRREIEQGRLEATRRGGSRVIPREELERYVQRRAAMGELSPVDAPMVHDLFERLERQAVELAELEQALEEAAENHAEERERLLAALKDARAALHRAGRGPDDPSDPAPPANMRDSLAPLFARSPTTD